MVQYLTSKTGQGRFRQDSLQSIGSNQRNPETAKPDENTPDDLELNVVKQTVYPVSSLNLLKRKVSPAESFKPSSANKMSRTSTSSPLGDQSASTDSSYSVKRKRIDQECVTPSPASPHTSSSESDSSGSGSDLGSNCIASSRPASPSDQSDHGMSANRVGGKSAAPSTRVRWTPEQV